MSGKDASGAEAQKQEWKPSINPWLSTLAVMLTTFMVVLDSSIANVALPKIGGSFSATQDESIWILTTYLVANGVILPTTAWFSTVFGRKRFLIICTLIFTLSSMLCGMSTSLEMLLVSRVLQGLGGGAILPIAQAIMLECFPKEKRGLAMSVYGIGLIFAPIIGPTLGGWITDTYSWHWIFLINVPLGIIAIILSRIFIEDPPYAKKGKMPKIDYWGFLLLVIWLFSLQTILDNGNKSDWLEARWVRWTTALCVSSLAAFIWRELKTKNPIIDLKVFLDRNFTVGTWLCTFIGAILYSTLAILPLFLQHILGYTATTSGLAISPRGFGSITGIIICAIFADKVDQRYLIAFGFFLLGLSTFMFGELNLSIGIVNIIMPNMLCGMGLGLVMVPLSTMTFSTLKNAQMTNGAGIFNLARSVGGAIGTSLVATLISRLAQVHQANLVRNLTYSNPVFVEKLSMLQGALGTHFGNFVAEQKAYYMIYKQLIQQSNLLAFMDCFKIYAALSIVLIPTVFAFKKIKYSKKSLGNERVDHF